MGLLHVSYGYGIMLSLDKEGTTPKILSSRAKNVVYNEEEGEGLYEYVENNYPLLNIEYAGPGTVGLELVIVKNTLVDNFEWVEAMDVEKLSVDDESKAQLDAFIERFGLTHKRHAPKWYTWTYFSY